jgi:hypothetical protein
MLIEGKFSFGIKLIWVVQSLLKKYSAFPNTKSALYLSPSRPTKGALAIVTDAGRDAVDAENASDEGICCGRQSRVVLTPQRLVSSRWRQLRR